MKQLDMFKDSEITMYSKAGCVPCRAAKAVLASRGIAYIEVRVDEDVDALSMLKEKGFRTVPQIEYGGKFYTHVNDLIAALGNSSDS